MTEELGKFGQPIVSRYPNDGRNYEFRALPNVSGIQVNRDGEVKYLNLNGQMRVQAGTIRDNDNNIMTIQMFIHLAFPDIPMREIPKW